MNDLWPRKPAGAADTDCPKGGRNGLTIGIGFSGNSREAK